MNKHSNGAKMLLWQRMVWVLPILLAAVSARAQVAIESVSGSVQSGVEVIRVNLTQPLTVAPAGFSIQSPARIALDFPGVTSVMGRSTVDVTQGSP